MRSMFGLLVLSVIYFITARADSLTVTFRYDDSTHKYVRAFLPADFNNWGPNNGGVIDTSASCKMQYAATHGYWWKQYRLKTGISYSYKIYLNLNQSGSQYSWISDPLNPRTDGGSQGNSYVTISDPMIFEPLRATNADGMITGITAGIFGGHTPLRILIIIDGDTTDVTAGYGSETGSVQWTFGSPVSNQSSMILRVVDSNGQSTYNTFWQAPPAPAYTVPSWAKQVVWYQIFPERFRNDDPSNDPVRTSLDDYQYVPTSWRISTWTADWYSRDSWEAQKSSNFYGSVFARRYGGDLKGVIDKLGYLDSLGINAIYLNPIFYARSLHKYDARSYHHIDPYFGPDPNGDIALMTSETLNPSTWHWTSADTLFLGLLREAHRRGMRVIIDGVFDHTGVDFPAFQDIVQNQQNSPYKDWYIVLTWDNPSTPQNEFTYQGWWGYSSLPQFARTPDGTNLAPGPKNYIYQITRRWMDPNGDGDPSDGIDGWRLDTVPDVPIDFWIDWNTFLRTINPDACTIAEDWSDAGGTVKTGRFSGTMNYHGCANPLISFLAQSEPASGFAADIAGNITSYGAAPALANQNLIDSHDTQRFPSMIVNAGILTGYNSPGGPNGNSTYNIAKPTEQNRRTQRLMILAQMSIPGAPMVYYGDEAGMWGATDPDCRMPMSWPDLMMTPQSNDPRGNTRPPDDVNYDQTVSAYYKTMIGIRRNSPALQQGNFQTLLTNDGQRTVVYSRSVGAEKVVAFLNRDSQQHTLSVPVVGLISSGEQAHIIGSTESDPSLVVLARTDSLLSVTLSAAAGALVRIVPGTAANLTVPAGWSMASLPRNIIAVPWNSLFPHALTIPYAHTDSGYQAMPILQPGRGYWLKYASPEIVSVDGDEFVTLTDSVHQGWNMIGVISSPVSPSTAVTSPPGIIVSNFFTYRRQYEKDDVLQPGLGYWVKVNQSGTITFMSGGLAKGKTAAIPAPMK